MKVNVALLNVALISSHCMTLATVTAATGGNRKLSKKKKKNKLEGKYFAEYNFYSAVYGGVRPSSDYQTFTKVEGAPDIYDWRECFSTDGGITYTKTKFGTAVLLDGVNYRINVFEEEDDLFDGFTIVGSIEKPGRIRYGLFSFFNTGSFVANGERTDVDLGDDACPV